MKTLCQVGSKSHDAFRKVADREELGTYTLKPYNVHLSPLVDPILGIDRIFSVSSGGD
jgi:hypothetical protein